ncbi:MAG TPA: hypothetical protein VHH35_03445 [Pyrinomonadaceae bacterium]|nr:hypothetical protein [Pyrinomonadaceae bacterium]
MSVWNFLAAGIMPSMIFGVLTLFLASGYFGTKAGVYLCWRENKIGLNVLIGLALAFGSNAISALAGSIFFIFVHDRSAIIELKDLMGILFTPLFTILIFGGLPAAFFGVMYGLLVGMRLEKLDPIKYSDVH